MIISNGKLLQRTLSNLPLWPLQMIIIESNLTYLENTHIRNSLQCSVTEQSMSPNSQCYHYDIISHIKSTVTHVLHKTGYKFSITLLKSYALYSFRRKSHTDIFDIYLSTYFLLIIHNGHLPSIKIRSGKFKTILSKE